MVKTATLATSLEAKLIEGALPAELEGFSGPDRADAARFVATVAAAREPGRASLALETMSSAGRRRRMRLAAVGDDMPFLVDSIAAAIGARGIAIDRIIHPVLPVGRDEKGRVTRVGDDRDPRESMIYIEMERADARGRRALLAELERVLANVRVAVADWPAMRAALAADADTVTDEEGAALLRWLAAGKMVLLGHERWSPAEGTRDPLGLATAPLDPPLLADASRQLALEALRGGAQAPLLIKSNAPSPVHRRAPLDLVVVPERAADGTVTGLAISAGLWTSVALGTPAHEVPLLRRRLAALEERFGFDPRGHAGKALAHALNALPRDLTITFGPEALEHVALVAMSIADRPRPKLALVRSGLGRHLFAFAWLPRDELTTARRVAIGEMLAAAAHGSVINWSLSLEESAAAQIRYTLDLRGAGRMPDEDALDERLARMVRGWVPAVEEALAVEDGRATRLALRFADAFPNGYRNAAGAEEAARDILRFADLEDDAARSVRITSASGRSARLKLYRLGGPIALSDAVPVFENFGFRVIEEVPTTLTAPSAVLHDFLVEPTGITGQRSAFDVPTVEGALAAVLEGRAENDAFNRLIVDAGLSPGSVELLRAWFRYLRQTGMAYGLTTVVDALRRAPAVAEALVRRFEAAHDPARGKGAEQAIAEAEEAIATGLDAVSAIDDDRILRAYHGVVAATLRTNAFAPARAEALAFKFDSAKVPGLPQPLPWREIFVYSPRVEGIHLRAGPVARGGLRWSDRRDDFRTEVLGLMKAQRVKNAVIVPTGAKGGFYAKHLPAPSDRDAWLAEGTEAYRIFIRSLLSITDNLVGGKVVHPENVVILDGDDPYFVVAADKGTASFSDTANGIAEGKGFWLGDAFASGGSHGYDHKAMGITAKGAWVSVQRHFAEMGTDVQADPVTVAGCGDMSGDVFGNGMLLSRSLRLVAAFDHRHIFIDPSPDAAASWEERARLFALPRSSWADYDPGLISAGGGVWPRTEKVIPLSPEAQQALGVAAAELDPGQLVSAILKAPVDLMWFGGIGTYVKAAAEAHQEVGDPANDRLRVNAEQMRARVIGEGANLGVTQAARIAFSEHGGRINTDFIDNSAGVDCSDNEVNIKIALNRAMDSGALPREDRDALLVEMTDEVAHLVLEDNRLQTLALSIMEMDGAGALPSYVRVIEVLEASGRLNREVEGLAPNDELLRRAGDREGLTRPELAVLLATAKLAIQDAAERSRLGAAPEMEAELLASFPPQMQQRYAKAIAGHPLRNEIVATEVANRVVNRMGVLHPFELAEEEGASLGDIAAMFVTAERLFALPELWTEIESAAMPERARIALFDELAQAARGQIADLLRVFPTGTLPAAAIDRLSKGVIDLDQQVGQLLQAEARAGSARIAERLCAEGAPAELVSRVVRLFELDGAVGLTDLARTLKLDIADLTRAFTTLGQTLGLDWAQSVAARLQPTDPWERLLIAGLARDFQQLRLDFLAAHGTRDPGGAVATWLEEHRPRVDQFATVVRRARNAGIPTAAMLAQIAGQARVLLGR